ncbi:MAG: DUF327 family protein [Treponema sp.]|nr:DUF327 family protein [Treponema sp.]
MNSIDSTSNGLYYNATQAVANQTAAQNAAQAARKNEKDKAVKKPAFSSMVEKQQAENLLASQGLPPEIAGLGQEEALVYLKDQLDLTGDALVEDPSGQNFENYKRAVSHFIKFMQKENFFLEPHIRYKRTPSGKKKDTLVLVQTIDKKLEQLNYDIWYNHLDKLKRLEKIHEINGLVVDLTAV